MKASKVCPAYDALTLTLVALEAAPAVIENAAEVAPAGTATNAGTVAMAGFPLLSETVTPPFGAAAVKVTKFPFSVVPLVIDVLASFREASATTGGRMVRRAETVRPPKDPEIVATVDAVTGEVTMLKVVELWPAGTVTLAGTMAWASEEVRATVTPGDTAAPVSVTVFRVVVFPPIAEGGLRLSELSIGPPAPLHAKVGPPPRYSNAPTSMAPTVVRTSPHVS
jgi:hypothetical protein